MRTLKQMICVCAKCRLNEKSQISYTKVFLSFNNDSNTAHLQNFDFRNRYPKRTEEKHMFRYVEKTTGPKLVTGRSHFDVEDAFNNLFRFILQILQNLVSFKSKQSRRIYKFPEKAKWNFRIVE